MAYSKKKTYAKVKNRTSQKSYTQLERLAYLLGKINQGLNNPDSRVFESYNNGCRSTNKVKKKSLI